MNTRVLVLAAALVAACCWSQEIVIIEPPRIAQVVDATTLLVFLKKDTFDFTCIVGVPTKELYEGGTVPANYGSKVLLIPAGVYKGEQLPGVQLRRLMWIHPRRISKQTFTMPKRTQLVCDACGGLGGKGGLRNCRKCNGVGTYSTHKDFVRTVIYIDGRPVKEND